MSIKFDETYIAVRQRNILETYDLALQIARDHFRKLFAALLLGIAPWMIIDFAILYRWLVAEEYFWYFLLAATLIVAQAPLGTAIITHFLGSVMFQKKQRVIKSTRETIKNYGKLLVVHGLTRLAIPITVFAALMMPFWDAEARVPYFLLLLGGMLGVALLVRAVRPYVTEVILLEKPVWSNESYNIVTFRRRNATLHMPAAVDSFSRAMTTFVFAAMLFVCFHGFFSVRAYITGNAGGDWLTLPLFVPLACWLAAGFTTIARFLSYMDLRIRQEGWEIELKLRAEAAKYLEKSRLS